MRKRPRIRDLRAKNRALWSDNVALKAALKRARIERNNLRRLLGRRATHG